MDCRVKPGNDEGGLASVGWAKQSVPTPSSDHSKKPNRLVRRSFAWAAHLRGGRGAGLDDSPATKATRRVGRPLHHASHGPPPPLSRGRIREGVLAARLSVRG